MTVLYNALQLKNGATTDKNKMGVLTQPVQFLFDSQKDDNWKANCMDWFEFQGIRQIESKYKRLLKNYKLVNGVIDKSDYIVEEDNEMGELLNILEDNSGSAIELEFYPIIPNVINLLVGEAAKRADRVQYRAVDDLSHNELLNAKAKDIENVLISKAIFNIKNTLAEMGVSEDSEEATQMLSQENLKSLPEIEEFYRKDYRSLIEEWATHQHEIDIERFRIKELELLAFKDYLTTDSPIFHFSMLEDDYDIEVWNPVFTFYHKSNNSKYYSDAQWVGKIDMMTVSEAIDKFGYKMSKDQLESLESIYPVRSAGYILPGIQNDGSFYDSTKSHDWNVEGPSLAMRQFMSHRDTFGGGSDFLSSLFDESEGYSDFTNRGMLKVTTCYWKSQKIYGLLTKIDSEGNTIQGWVDETYIVVDKPVYNTKVLKTKTAENLIFGDHVEWIWVNESWGGTKIGQNRPTFYGNDNSNGFDPIYLDVKPLKFQFKGDYSMYGCKLPVEGFTSNHRNIKSTSLVDRMKPFQIAYNLVNNQIKDILIDELGTIILLDQNSLPQKSMGEDWGKNNFSKAYTAMKNFQILPLDLSLANTENPTSFQHYQTLNLDQTQRLMSRINLSNYFKQQAFESVGITPQRLGGISAEETATATNAALSMSYSQTEFYFLEFFEHLMPRVHQMRTDLAQYYHSNNPSVRLQYMTTEDEKVNFEINGTDLLSRDLNIYITTKTNQRQLIQDMKSLVINNNTSGANIFDLGSVLKAQSVAEINAALRAIEDKSSKIREQEYQQQLELENLRIKSEQEMFARDSQRELNRLSIEVERDIKVAEIKSAGYAGSSDLNNNLQNDYIDTLNYLDKRNNNQSKLTLDKEKENNKVNLETQKIQLKKSEILARERMKDKELQIAKENKNKHDKK